MKPCSILLAGAVVLVSVPALVSPGWAQSVTPEQQAALEAQLKSWYSLGRSAFTAGPGPYTVTAAGDHFDVVAPIRLSGQSRGDMRVTAQAKPGDGGKWTWTQVRTSVPFQMVLDMPVPPKEGDKGPPKTVAVTYVVNAASQDGAMTYDPSFATASSMVTGIKGLTVDGHGNGFEQTSTIEQTDNKASLTPAGGDLVDVALESTLSGYKLDSKAMGDTPAMLVTVDKAVVTGGMAGVSRGHADRLFQVMAKIGGLNKAGGPAPKTLPPAEMGELVAALRDFGSAGNLLEVLDGLKVNVGGMAFALDQVRFGLDGKSDGGLLRLAVEIGYRGLAMPELGLGDAEALVPQQASFRPYVSGVSVADAAKVLTAYNNKRDPTAAEIGALFSHGGVVSGLESMLLDVGGARFTGEGKVVATSPQAFTGTARVQAENFDALVGKVQALPMAQQAVPAVIFLKGIGRNEGGKLVWDVNYAGGKVLVNNIDLSAMTGAAPGPGGAAKGPAPRPQGPQQRRP